jgi:hypothetical protein
MLNLLLVQLFPLTNLPACTTTSTALAVAAASAAPALVLAGAASFDMASQ